jgi:hypothetical protein
MSGQGMGQLSGEKAVDGWANSVTNLMVGCLEIQVSTILINKYGDRKLDGTMIFTLPDGTITGHIGGVFNYMAKVINRENKKGMDLVDLIVSEVKLLDVEVSEDVA